MRSNPIKHRSVTSQQSTEISSSGAGECSGHTEIETELYWHCINNLTVTYGVKTYHWGDTSKQ